MNSKLLTPLLLVVFAVVLVLSCNVFGILGLFVPMIASVALISANRPRRLLAMYWFLILFIPSLEAILPGTIVKLLEQGTGVYILALVCGEYAITRRGYPGTALLLRGLLILLAVIATSTIVNKVPPRSFLFFMLTYMNHYWIFFFALRHLRAEDGKHVLYVLLVSLLIQIPFNAAGYLGLNPLPRIFHRVFVDFSVGTVGNCHHVGYYMVALIVLMTTCLKYFRTGWARVGCFLAAALSAVQFYLTFAIHAYPLYIGGIAWAYLMPLSRSEPRRLMRGIILLLVVAGALSFFLLRGPQRGTALQVLSQGRMQMRLQEMVAGTKGEAYRHVFLHAGRYLPYPFVGGGPGNYTSMVAFVTRRPLAWLPHMAYRVEALDQRAVRGASMSSVPWTGMITLWGELGPLGWALYWGTHLYAAWRIFMQRRRRQYRDRYRIILAEAFVPVMLAFILLNIMIEAIAKPHLSLGMWIWAAAVWNPPPPDEPAEAQEPGDTPPAKRRLPIR